MEYVALGIPAVVSRLETLAMYFDDDEVTFFEPGNVASLASALRWVAEHPEQARDKATRATERFHEYAWPRNRERYVRMLRELTLDRC